MISKLKDFILLSVLFISCTFREGLYRTDNSKNANDRNNRLAKADSNLLKKDTVISKPKLYQDLITSEALTQNSFLKIHKIKERFYFEIPDSLFERDILIVSRIAEGAAEGQLGIFGYAGDDIGSRQIRFSKGPNNKIFIKRVSYMQRASDSSENGLYTSVMRSNLLPILSSFDIKAFSPDSSSSVIDVTDLINSESEMLFFDAKFRDNIKNRNNSLLGAFQPDKSYIKAIKTFPINIEIKTIKTFGKEYSSFTYELNTSIVLLPKEPMRARYEDERIGYFNQGFVDFDSDPQRVVGTRIITRWRLEPNLKDKDKYMRGELVEPQNPIVFYIDPCTPRKWVPFLIQGVNDWQKAFEKAGFKNAIYALPAPLNDSTWSIEDARHNVIVYKPSSVPNASGPNIHDPRSGEIIESHVNWYHNVMLLLHDWYLIQAGAIDPRARRMEFDDSLMGQLIRFVSSHEIGHTLGLTHNMGASSTIPVEKLRDKVYLEENGFCPSIMDYARFNYVAQPEDSVTQKGIFPRIGVYDEFAVEFGYKWLPELQTKQQEKAFFNSWIISKLCKDKRLYFGNEYGGDPRNQAEDLGDDAIKASYYGIKNLKRILPNLPVWTKVPNEMNYKSLDRMQNEVLEQFKRYINHVTEYIGGKEATPKTIEQDGPLLQFTEKKKQKAAVQFLQDELFDTPEWLIDRKIFSLVGGYGVFGPLNIQRSVLQKIMSFETFTNLFWFQGQDHLNAYTVDEFLTDLEAGILKELKSSSPIDIYRRNLQKIYVSQLIQILIGDAKMRGSIGQQIDAVLFGGFQGSTDLLSITQAHIRKLIAKINIVLPKYSDQSSKEHLIDIRDRLVKAVDPNTVLYPTSGFSMKSVNNDNFRLVPFSNNIKNMRGDCWYYYKD